MADSAEPITDKRPLVEYLEAACTPPDEWRIGVEHEKFAFRTNDLSPLPYDGEVSIRALLKSLTNFNWTPVFEGDALIGLERGVQSISLEPAGQFELGGAPLRTLHEIAAELCDHLTEAKVVGGDLGIGFLGSGFQPKSRRSDIPWMPKSRYRIMRDYMPTTGRLGLDMMARTCSLQVNLDFSSEADMVEKFRVALALHPVATALSLNAPFVDGGPSGFLSYRAQTWLDTDPARTGLLPFVFEDGMGFERYVDYALDVPMYSVQRGAHHVDTSGQSFRDFLDGQLPALPGERPTMDDWNAHLQTLMPEVRLKHVLEMRGADAGPLDQLCALPAFWVGLLYDSDSLAAAWELVEHWGPEEREAIRRTVPRMGLETPSPDSKLQTVAARALDIAEGGLERRNHAKAHGSEASFLAAFRDVVETGCSAADSLINAYFTRWDASIDPIFMEQRY